MAELYIVSGSRSGDSLELNQRDVIIGRSSTCDVVLRSRTISREHARIVCDSDGYYLEDMRSINGTLLNGRRIARRTPLEHGDRIQVFDVELHFFVKPPSKLYSPPPAEESAVTPPGHEISVADLEWNDDPNTETNRLGAILKMTRALSGSLEVDAILSQLLDGLFELLPQADRGYVLQPDDHDRNLEYFPTAIKHRSGISDTISPISSGIARKLMHESRAFLSCEPDTTDGQDVLDHGVVRSTMCAPLVGPSDTAMGIVHIETSNGLQPFDASDLEALVAVCLLAGQALEFSKLHESVVELDHRNRETLMAKEMQLKFLPQRIPELPGYEFFHRYQAVDYVAGDYFDYVPLPDGRLAVIQADVCGKGLSAAIFVAWLSAEVRYCLLAFSEPNQTVRELNRLVCEQLNHYGFVTFLLMIIDPRTHHVEMVNAGHPYPLLRESPEIDATQLFAKLNGSPLGIQDDAEYVTRRFQLQPRQTIICYTDGLSEAVDAERRMYGDAGISEALRNGTSNSPAVVGKMLLNDVRSFLAGNPLSDDLCIVCFGRP